MSRVTVTVTSIEEFKTLAPEAYEVFIARMNSEDAEWFDGTSFMNYIHALHEMYDSSREKIDSLYITETYETKIEGFRFEVVGQSYRKDQSVCDEELVEEIYITDIALEKIEKEKMKSGKTAANREAWADFIANSTQEQLLETLKDIKFPKKSK